MTIDKEARDLGADATWAWFLDHGADAVRLEPWEPWYERRHSGGWTR